jgi:hypothetical protein
MERKGMRKECICKAQEMHKEPITNAQETVGSPQDTLKKHAREIHREL